MLLSRLFIQALTDQERGGGKEGRQQEQEDLSMKKEKREKKGGGGIRAKRSRHRSSAKTPQ